MSNQENHTTDTPIDIEFLMGIVENDAEFKRELLEIFIESAQLNLNKLKDAISTNDNNSWYMAAHAFKGAATSIGAFNLSQKLEHAQKHPEENTDHKKKTLDAIEKDFNLALDFINNTILAEK